MAPLIFTEVSVTQGLMAAAKVSHIITVGCSPHTRTVDTFGKPLPQKTGTVQSKKNLVNCEMWEHRFLTTTKWFCAFSVIQMFQSSKQNNDVTHKSFNELSQNKFSVGDHHCKTHPSK